MYELSLFFILFLASFNSAGLAKSFSSIESTLNPYFSKNLNTSLAATIVGLEELSAITLSSAS